VQEVAALLPNKRAIVLAKWAAGIIDFSRRAGSQP
jgi:hypothetical protein